MTLNPLRLSAVTAFGAILLTIPVLAQTRPTEPSSPYGGVVVEDIIARVNDQIITRSDYDRAMKELDDEGRQHGASMQQISDAHKDLLRNLIDQQLWLSKGKELGINGETELVTRLNEIRKQYNLSSMEDLEKAAQEQGVSFEDFKANIRNQIVTQQVMRDEVGRHISLTPGEVQRYFEQHKQEYAQPESVHLSEILVSTGANADDQQKVDAAKAKADDIEAKLKAGANFAELARTSSDGTTAAQGGDLGTYKHGELAKVFEDASFGLKAGQFTEPIRTRQGFVIFRVDQHNPGGSPQFKDVENQVEESYYMAKMEPAIRQHLTKMREDAYIAIKTGYTDTGTSPNARVQPISYSAYTPPAPKKKKKIERTRFRETTHFRQKAAAPASEKNEAKAEPAAKPAAKAKKAAVISEKAGKKEKIRLGKAPTKTLPATPQGVTEDAGANPQVAQSTEPENNPIEAAPEVKKTRFSERARTAKKAKKNKSTGFKTDALAPAAPDAAEVADRQTQSAALGLNGAVSKKKKKDATTSEKTRYSEKKKDTTKENQAPVEPTPIAPVPGAPAPPSAPQPTQQQKQ